MKTGDKIKNIRKTAGISQADLGRMLGVSQAMISAYEQGARNPKLETLEKIAEALSVSAKELLPDTDYNRILGDKALTAYSAILEQIIGLKGYTFGITEDDDSLYITYPDGILKVTLEMVERLQEDIESFTDFKMQELKKNHIESFIPKGKFDYKTKKCRKD